MREDAGPIAEAESWLLDFAESGAARPQVFQCTDEVERVLKIPGLGMTSRTSLIHE